MTLFTFILLFVISIIIIVIVFYVRQISAVLNTPGVETYLDAYTYDILLKMEELGAECSNPPELIRMVHSLLPEPTIDSDFYQDKIDETPQAQKSSKEDHLHTMDSLTKVIKNPLLQHYLAKYHTNSMIFSFLKHYGEPADPQQLKVLYKDIILSFEKTD